MFLEEFKEPADGNKADEKRSNGADECKRQVGDYSPMAHRKYCIYISRQYGDCTQHKREFSCSFAL